MNILIAPDSFKESLTAIEVCDAIKSGFEKVFPDADYTLSPMADGGEGTTDVLSYILGGQWITVKVHDPLLRPITAKYLLLPDATAVIEIAQACGLHLLTSSERDPLITSSYGVGEMIIDALDKGAKRFIIGLGGSATNDAGVGMLTALGMRFYDKGNHIIAAGGGALAQLQHIDDSGLDMRIVNTVFDVACDVTNPLYGVFGASAVFAAQKGANRQQVTILDNALSHFATLCTSYGCQKYHDIAGAGAAGGLGFALMTFCNATLGSGFNTVAEAVYLAEHIAQADIVITGEGSLDAQTAMGKVVDGVSKLAKAHHTPTIAICGSVEKLPSHPAQSYDVVMPSIQKLDSIEIVLIDAYNNITTTAFNIAAAIRLGQQLVPKNKIL